MKKLKKLKITPEIELWIQIAKIVLGVVAITLFFVLK